MPTNSLDEFNQQVLLCQDDAFDFACALLGDESAAEDLTCRAFRSVYTCGWKPGRPIRLSVLRCILAEVIQSPPTPGNEGFLSDLPLPERVVIWLVDRLGLDPGEAADLLHISPFRTVQLLSNARHKIANYDRIMSRNTHDENTYSRCG